MTIKQLLDMPVGKENRTGGFQLTVKVARKTVTVDNKQLQWVVFMDETGEIPGEVSLPKYIPLIKNQRINIIICWLQPGEHGKKLYVEQYQPILGPSEPEEFRINSAWGPDDAEALAWTEARREEVKGKCRHGVVCSMLQAGTKCFEIEKHKEIINKVVDFIVTGE